MHLKKFLLFCFALNPSDIAAAAAAAATAAPVPAGQGVRCGLRQDASWKLFIFGDSYVDTGNIGKTYLAWKEPYGVTFPGHPTGRYSDGLILADYIAQFFGKRGLANYQARANQKELIPYGMNFAYGGAGIFDTTFNVPNLTAQIQLLQDVIENEQTYSKRSLESSVAVVSIGGNDYVTHLANATQREIRTLAESLVNQIELDLKRIQSLGVSKVCITTVEPFGCMPYSTSLLDYKSCSASANSVADLHNRLLRRTVTKLNTDGSKGTVFGVLELNAAFISTLAEQNNTAGGGNNLKQCCGGVTQQDFCGTVDEKGVKGLCQEPLAAFFWDGYHPTEKGWSRVFSKMQYSLYQLYGKRCVL